MKRPDLAPDVIVTTEQAAEFLKVTPRLLEELRRRGGGPPYFKVGRLVRYRLSDLEAWIDQEKLSSTAEATERARGVR